MIAREWAWLLGAGVPAGAEGIPPGAIPWALLALAGIAGSALCSAGEIGSYAVNRLRLDLRAERGLRRARVLRGELAHPERHLASLLIANNIFNNLGALGISGVFRAAGLSDGATVALNALLLTPTLLIFAETLPKEVFRVRADALMERVAIPLRVMRVVLTAALLLPGMMGAVALLRRSLGGGGGQSLTTGPQRVAELLKESAQHGLISEAQASLLDRALALRRTTVAAEMVPWRRVVTVRLDSPRHAVLTLLAQQPYARFPAVDRSGRVVGIIEHLDVCLGPERALASLVRPALTLDPDLNVREALERLTRAGARLAIVQAPGGRPMGVVTAKDLVEPLTGDLGAW